MNIKKLLASCLFLLGLLSCKKEQEVAILPQIIPQPNQMEITEGVFELNPTIGIKSPTLFLGSSNYLKAFIEKGASWELNSSSERDIEFVENKNLSAEGYQLNVTPNRIVIKAATDQGAFYAVQSLRQLLPVSFENGTFKDSKTIIPCLEIIDEPRFQYRGMHLDVSRHMFPVSFIKSYIDALALLKINKFHWHLTDDQGWRIEIKKFPKLQGEAAFRDKTLKGHYNDEPVQYQNERYGGFYSQEEIREVVAYAKERHITVIPEIEMPGHAQAALSAYPELGCTGNSIETAATWGVFEDIFCSKDETFEFLEGVLDEVVELFPSEYIHIGGDEAPKTRWKACENCQKRIQEEGLKDEFELQSYFIKRIEKYLSLKGKRIIGWDEILEGGLSPNSTVMSWRGFEGAITAAKQGNDVVMTPSSHCYFDYYQSEGSNEPTAIGGFLPLEKVYSLEPIPEELDEMESKHILGAQGNLWTEYIPNRKQVEYMVFPRILALSEVVWTQPEFKNYKEFVQRVEHFHKRLNALGIHYANHLYDIEGGLIVDDGKSVYEMKTLTNGKIIKYTLDGSSPNKESLTYGQPIPFSKDMEIHAAVFRGDEKVGSDFHQKLWSHKAVGKHIELNVSPHKAYQGSGANGLVNGIWGSSTRYGDKEWLGFWGDDLEIMINFEEETDIDSVSTRFYDGQGQWIYAPKEVIFEANGKQITYPVNGSEGVLINFKIEPKIRTTSFKLIVPNYGTIPEGKQGAGNKAWTFIDEIVVK